ncbi:MAG: response regulator [Sandaracinaceae bacterium]|nr:response regulator [Sandaracinaceae bacterium]
MAINVLVVDDSAMARKMIVRVLHMAGLPLGTVGEAGDGVDGLAQLEAAEHDLAILDINMPRMNGLDLLARIRGVARLRSLPVLMVSTEGSDVRVERVKELGAGFLRKPFAPEDLVEAVVEAIGGAS